jgi:hypothetical protein
MLMEGKDTTPAIVMAVEFTVSFWPISRLSPIESQAP